MSGGGGQQTTTQTVEIPPEFQQFIFGGGAPGFGGVLPEAQTLFQEGQLAPTPVIGDVTRQAQQRQLELAGDLGGFNTQLLDIFGGFGEDAGGIADIATEGLQRQLERQTLPSIGQAAQQAGQFGSSRQGIAEGLATAEANRDIADIRSQILFEGAQRQLGFAPLLAQQLGIPANILSQVGAQQDVQAQQESESQFQNLLRLAQLIQGFIPGASQTQVTEGGGPNRIASTAGGALSGAGLGAQIGTIGGLPGTAVGAGLGGLIGLLS